MIIYTDICDLGKETRTYTAVLGNTQQVYEPDLEKTVQKTLLRDISDDMGVLVDKEWFKLKKLETLSKKHIGQKISFTATCEKYAVKTDKGPELQCIFSKLSDIELIEK